MNRSPDSWILEYFENCLSIMGAMCAPLAKSGLRQLNHERICILSRRDRGSDEVGDEGEAMKIPAQVCRDSRRSETKGSNLKITARTGRALRMSKTEA